MTSWLGIQTAKAKDVQDVSGQMYIDLAKELQARNQVKKSIRALTPEEIGENQAYHAKKNITPAESAERELEFDNIRHWMERIIPDYARIKEDPIALRAAISKIPDEASNINRLSPQEISQFAANPLWNFKDDFESYVPYVVNYSKHLKDREHVNRYPLVSKHKIKEAGRSFENNSFKGAAPEYFQHRYGDVFAGEKNNRLLKHLSGPEEIAFPTKYEELKRELGYNRDEKITARELERLQNFDMDKALVQYQKAKTLEERHKYLHEYNHARSAQALAFMEPRERAISAKSNYDKALKEAGTDEAKIKAAKASYENEPRLQVHYPLEEEVTLNPHDYPGEWYANQPSEITEGNEALKESAKELTANSKLMRDERKTLYDKLNGRTSIGDMTDEDLRRLRLNASDMANAIDDSDYIDSRTYKRFQDEAKQEYGFVEKKINQRLQDDIRAVRSQYSARGQHGPALLKQENDMRSRAAEQLQRTYHDLINSFQKQGISATQAERADKANKVNLYRGATGQENQALLNSAQMKAQNEMSHQQLAHQNLLQKHQAMLLPNVATNDQANALINIGTRQQTNAQNKNNTLRYQHLANHQNWFNERMGLINAAQGIPTPPTFQANAMTPAMPVANSHASQIANIAGTIANQAGNIVQGQQNQGRPQNIYIGNHPYAHGGHVSSNDLMKAYHSQLDAYEKAARGYASQHEDYLPTGLQAAGDAFLGIARQGRGGDPLKGFAEGMDKGQERHNQYMKRGREREGSGLQLEHDMAKGRGQAWKDLASHENEVSKIAEQRRYHDAHLGIERDKLALEYHKAANPTVKRDARTAKILKEGWKEAEAAVNMLSSSASIGAARQFMPSENLTRINPEGKGILPSGKTLASLFGKSQGENSLKLMNLFDTDAANAGLYANVLANTKNEHGQKMVERSKYNLANDPSSTFANATSNASSAGSFLASTIENLREMGVPEETIQRRIDKLIKNANKKRIAKDDEYESIGNLDYEKKKKLKGDSDKIWNTGLSSLGWGDREASNFNEPSLQEEDPKNEEVNAPAPSSLSEVPSSPVDSSTWNAIKEGATTAADFAGSGAKKFLINAAKGVYGPVDMATWPIRKGLDKAFGTDIKGLNETFVEPVERDYEQEEGAKDRGLLAKSALEGVGYAGNMLGSSVLGAGLVGGALKGGAPLADRGIKAFGRAIKGGDIGSASQHVGRVLGGESAMKALSGNTTGVKELAQLTGMAAATGATSKGIQEGVGVNQIAGDLAAIPLLLATQGAVKGASNLFKTRPEKLSKDLQTTEDLIGEYLFPREESLARHEQHFNDFVEPHAGYKSTAAEAANGITSNVAPLSRKVGASSDTAKNRQVESHNLAKKTLEEAAPSSEFLNENKLKEGDLLHQIVKKGTPEITPTTQDTAASIRKSFKETISGEWKKRKEASEEFYDQIKDYKEPVTLSNSKKILDTLIDEGDGPEHFKDVKWFSDKLKSLVNKKTNKTIPDENIHNMTSEEYQKMLKAEAQAGEASMSASDAHSIAKSLRVRADKAYNDKEWPRFRVLNELKRSIDEDVINAVPAAEKATSIYREYSVKLNNITKDKSLSGIANKKDGKYTMQEQSTVDHFLRGKHAVENSRELISNIGYNSEAANSLRDYMRADLYGASMKNGKIDLYALDQWQKANRGASNIDKNIDKEINSLKSVASLQELGASGRNITPERYRNFMESHAKRLSRILSESDMAELHQIGKIMENRGYTLQKILAGESGTNVLEDMSKRIFYRKESAKKRAFKEGASKLPVIGKFVKPFIRVVDEGNPKSMSPERLEHAADILNDVDSFKQFMSRVRARRIVGGDMIKPNKSVGINRLIDDMMG